MHRILFMLISLYFTDEYSPNYKCSRSLETLLPTFPHKTKREKKLYVHFPAKRVINATTLAKGQIIRVQGANCSH